MKIPIYYSKVGESEEFLNILPAKLTINEILPHFYKDRWSRPDITIFKEVKIKPYGKHNLDDAEFIAKGKWDRETTYEEVFEYLKKAIYKVWIPDRFHIVGCSSGYDSRLIAKAIIQLTEEHGEKWAGQVVFVEVMGEKPFRDIIKAWGINGIAYNYKSPPNWYHSHGLQFGEFYQKYNGVFAFPFNQWYDAFKDLHEQGKIQKDNI